MKPNVASNEKMKRATRHSALDAPWQTYHTGYYLHNISLLPIHNIGIQLNYRILVAVPQLVRLSTAMVGSFLGSKSADQELSSHQPRWYSTKTQDERRLSPLLLGTHHKQAGSPGQRQGHLELSWFLSTEVQENSLRLLLRRLRLRLGLDYAGLGWKRLCMSSLHCHHLFSLICHGCLAVGLSLVELGLYENSRLNLFLASWTC